MLQSQDLKLTLMDGAVFSVDSVMGTTGLVLIGRGQMEFAPAPQTEREQLRLFGGAETLSAPFDTAFVRLNPGDFEARQVAASLVPAAIDAGQLRRARNIFAAEAVKSFSVDLGDLSRDTWYLLPASGDFLAEVRTRRQGALTYAHSGAEAEDVKLFERARGRDMARYASPDKLRIRGAFYNEDDFTDYDVLDYDVEATVSPQRRFIEAKSRMRIRVRSAAMAVINVRLAESLTVLSVWSPEIGRLMHIRVRGRDTVVVNLPVTLRRDAEIALTIEYAGRLPNETLDQESLMSAQGPGPDRGSDSTSEPYYLLSSKAYWYPQAPTSDYATATIRVTVPGGYVCVASGELAPGFPAAVPGTGEPGRVYLYRAIDPVRYLAVLISRFRPVGRTVVSLVDEPAPETPRLSPAGARVLGFRLSDRVVVTGEAVPRLEGRGCQLNGWAADILRYYSSLIGEAPYPSLAVATVEHPTPGGHGPAYFVMVHNPPSDTPLVWRNDPANFQDFPEFFVAHEIAHQWWGQAVGWKNYHEQWLSEGFAQYFAALYARQRHGDETFLQMLKQFRRWSISDSGQGPIYLGYRLGQISGDRLVVRAPVYNKGAAVLHMLRRLVGDEAFFGALRRFYYERKFDKAGTNDLQLAFEVETGRSLQRFFDGWIYGSRVPKVQFQTAIAEREVTVRFRQLGDIVFDLPATVTVTYADGRAVDVMVPVTSQSVERKIPVDGPVRNVRVNRDNAAIAEFEGS